MVALLVLKKYAFKVNAKGLLHSMGNYHGSLPTLGF